VANPSGFPSGPLKVARELPKKRAAELRVLDYREFEGVHSEDKLRAQASRCMDCGVPFCHNGCPLGNVIPEWNDATYHGDFLRAEALLARTNNFPEFTGRICPAPCEAACVLNLSGEPVTIKQVEKAIAERVSLAPQRAPRVSGKRVAIVGSGPAGLAAAQQLARAGHEAHVFERDDRLGGLLRYGIPDFKLEKWRIDRRVAQLVEEGVVFHTGVEIGRDQSLGELREKFAAVLLATGAGQARDLPIPGRELHGVHLAMEYLTRANRAVAGDGDPITAAGKHVIILGGGDTGADCLGTAHRQGARSVTQLELMPRPPDAQPFAWPNWPMVYRTSPAHEEGGAREFSVRTARFVANGDAVSALECTRDGEIFTLPADLVLLALGFTGGIHPADFTASGVAIGSGGDSQTYVIDGNFRTSTPGVYACGDAHRGASLVVWAIAEGRGAAAAIDAAIGAVAQPPS
jgi:glutamate synthase (NADPH/NADH) small chain